MGCSNHSFRSAALQSVEKREDFRPLNMKNLLLSCLAVAVCALSAVRAQDDPVIPYAELAGEFAANSTAADQKYQGQYLTVRARVVSLSQDGGAGSPLSAVFGAPDNDSFQIKADFSLDTLGPDWASISISDDGTQAMLVRRNREGEILENRPLLIVGEERTISGSYQGYVAGDMILRDASLRKKAE